jgi:hypothetical protein
MRRAELLESTATIPDVAEKEQTETAAISAEAAAEHLPLRNDRRPRQRVAKAHRDRAPPPSGTPIDDLDQFVYGAENIGRVINLDARKTFYALEAGYIDAEKFGTMWRSTKRRLLTSKPAAPPVPTPTPQQHNDSASAASL